MRKLKTFFYSLKKTLIDLEYHQDIAQANFWFSVKYLWFLLFILIFIQGLFLGNKYLKSRPTIKTTINQAITYVEKVYPDNLEIKIKNGQLQTNAKEPYVFYLNKKGAVEAKPLVIIDTKGSIENYPQYNTYILATKNAIIYPSKINGDKIGQTSIFFFSNIKKDLIVNKKILNNFINKIKPYTSKVVYFIDFLVLTSILLLISFGSFIWLIGIMFILLILTFFVWIVNLIFKKGHNYKTLYQISLHAITWPIIINEATKYLGITISGIYPIAFFIYFFIILFL